MEPQKKFYYFGYGQNRNPKMIQAIIGRIPPVYWETTIDGYELCIQNIDQIPEKSRKIIEETQGDKAKDFKSYVMRPKEGSKVKGTVYIITEKDQVLIRNYELTGLGWRMEEDVSVHSPGNFPLQAYSEVLIEDQEISEVVDGEDYPDFLNDETETYATAERVRNVYLDNLRAKEIPVSTEGKG